MDTSEKIINLFAAEENRLRIMREVRFRVLAEDGLLDRSTSVDTPQNQEVPNADI